MLPPDSMFITGTGANRRSVELNRLHSCLNPKQVKALLGLHALSGCDTTGCFKNRGKLSFWKVFESSEDDVLDAFSRLGCPEIFTPEDEKLIEKFICRIYLKGNQISDILVNSGGGCLPKKTFKVKICRQQGQFYTNTY